MGLIFTIFSLCSFFLFSRLLLDLVVFCDHLLFPLCCFGNPEVAFLFIEYLFWNFNMHFLTKTEVTQHFSPPCSWTKQHLACFHYPQLGASWPKFNGKPKGLCLPPILWQAWYHFPGPPPAVIYISVILWNKPTMEVKVWDCALSLCFFYSLCYRGKVTEAFISIFSCLKNKMESI